MDGMFSARLTRQVDVYAFAMVCVEILTKGALPWPMMDDEAVRRSVLRKSALFLKSYLSPMPSCRVYAIDAMRSLICRGEQASTHPAHDCQC